MTKKTQAPASKRREPSLASQVIGLGWFSQTVGPIFKAARERKGLSAQDVSFKSGNTIHPRMVSQYERATTPKIDTFLVLCAIYGLEPDKVFGAAVNRMIRDGKSSELAQLFE